MNFEVSSAIPRSLGVAGFVRFSAARRFWFSRAALGARRISRKAGSREGLQGSENAFLLLGDQNQKYSSGSEQKIRAGRPDQLLLAFRRAKRASPMISLPAFPPSC
jgi:hypothetical protein